jgi:hypothetical protein
MTVMRVCPSCGRRLIVTNTEQKLVFRDGALQPLVIRTRSCVGGIRRDGGGCGYRSRSEEQVVSEKRKEAA